MRFRDLDLFGHVNNAVYLTYLEEARIAFFVSKGLRPTGKLTPSTILAHVDIDYRKPAHLGDVLNVGVQVSKLGNSSITLAYRITRNMGSGNGDGAAAADGDELLAEANSVQVCFDFDSKRPVPIPAKWRSLLRD